MNKHSSGFSLIEVLITLIVVGVGLLAMARFQTTILRDTDLARQRTEAATVVQDQLERFRGFKVQKNASAFNAGIASDTQSLGGLNTTYDLSSIVNGNGNSKTVDSRVSWTNLQGNADDTKLNLAAVINRIDPEAGAETAPDCGTGVNPCNDDDGPVNIGAVLGAVLDTPCDIVLILC